jgi:hypothetical protein
MQVRYRAALRPETFQSVGCKGKEKIDLSTFLPFNFFLAAPAEIFGLILALSILLQIFIYCKNLLAVAPPFTVDRTLSTIHHPALNHRNYAITK